MGRMLESSKEGGGQIALIQKVRGKVQGGGGKEGSVHTFFENPTHAHPHRQLA